MSRMEGDIDSRRRSAFMKELSACKSEPILGRSNIRLSAHATCLRALTNFLVRVLMPDASILSHVAEKDPRFRPGMLVHEKSKLPQITLEPGPVIKSHKANLTGLESPRRA